MGLTKAKAFCLPDENNKKHCLKDYKGKWIVLYFYPKDNTSGCTREAVEFSDNIKKFEKMNAVVIGVSKDSTESHKKFREKHNLTIVLLSDTEHKVIEKYGAWGKKKLYGKEYFGTVRSTFLINPDGYVVKEWRKVKVNGHVSEVLETLKSYK